MEEKKAQPGEIIIEQGDDGDNLYILESGELECFRREFPEKEAVLLKTYVPGEAFGELALLYNAPRAATIKAKTEAVLWCLDRATFNHIVRDSSMYYI